MKKSDKIMLAIYIVIGVALVIIGVTIQVDYYSSMIFAMGFALIFSSIMQSVRYYHHARLENVEEYRKKVRQQEISLKDERKVPLRNRAGYISWAVTMVSCRHFNCMYSCRCCSCRVYISYDYISLFE